MLDAARKISHPLDEIEIEHIGRYRLEPVDRRLALADRLNQGFREGTVAVPFEVFQSDFCTQRGTEDHNIRYVCAGLGDLTRMSGVYEQNLSARSCAQRIEQVVVGDGRRSK